MVGQLSIQTKWRASPSRNPPWRGVQRMAVLSNRYYGCSLARALLFDHYFSEADILESILWSRFHWLLGTSVIPCTYSNPFYKLAPPLPEPTRTIPRFFSKPLCLTFYTWYFHVHKHREEQTVRRITTERRTTPCLTPKGVSEHLC